MNFKLIVCSSTGRSRKRENLKSWNNGKGNNLSCAKRLVHPLHYTLLPHHIPPRPHTLYCSTTCIMYPSIIRGKGLGGREGGGQEELKAPYAARSGTAHGATPVGFSALALAARRAGLLLQDCTR